MSNYKDSFCYNLAFHTHDKDYFHNPQNLKLASGTHKELILNRDKNITKFIKKIAKKLQRQSIQSQINLCFTPAV